MSKYKLIYFDFDGGRGEAIRIAFHAAGIAFDDHRISFEQFGELRTTMRFSSVPVLEIDGAQVTQANAISRYVGKLAGLYPRDDLQALYCDEVLGALEDLTHYIVQTMRKEGDELKRARETLVAGWMSTYLRGLGQLLDRGGEYFADNALTVADLRAFVQTRSLRAGNLEHVPADLVDRVAPALVEHQARIAADPRVTAYYESRKKTG